MLLSTYLIAGLGACASLLGVAADAANDGARGPAITNHVFFDITASGTLNASYFCALTDLALLRSIAW